MHHFFLCTRSYTSDVSRYVYAFLFLDVARNKCDYHNIYTIVCIMCVVCQMSR
jgi:hypothetical protein